MKRLINLLLMIFLLINYSCGRSYREEDLTQEIKTEQDSIKERQALIKENLEKTNQIVIAKELEKIRTFIERSSWQMQEKDGVFIQILDKGNSKTFQDGEKLSLDYQCKLLSGEEVYNSKTDGKIYIKIGTQSDCPLGLQKAVSNLYHKSKARIIVPSSLAYGLSGDGNKIPRAATLIYEIEID
jgi:FKBP-type peptidyl-prolyl cis-trans isomerase